MSGAGKSHAIRALEDLGYYCVDNLPTALIPVLADLSLREDEDKPKVAVVVDVRERRFIREFPPIWRRLIATPSSIRCWCFSRRTTRRCSGASAKRGGRIRSRPIGRWPKRSTQERKMLAPIRADGGRDRRHVGPHGARAARRSSTRWRAAATSARG